MPTPTTTPRLTCRLDEIDTRDLLRQDIGDIDELVQSFRDNIAAGLPPLIHPVVLDGAMRLLSGSRRLAAHRKLGLTEIDYAFYAVLDDAERVRIEVDANKQKLFTWQERVLGIDKYHRYYVTKAHLSGESWGVRETGSLLNRSKSAVGKSIFIAEYITAGDKEICDAASMEDAYRVLIKREEEAAAKLLVAQTIPSSSKPRVVPAKPTAAEVSDDDFFESLTGTAIPGNFIPGISSPVTTDERPGGPRAINIVPLSDILLKEPSYETIDIISNLPDGSTQHVITDWPYAIDMDMLNQQNPAGSMLDIADVELEHQVQKNRDLQAKIVPQIYRVMRDGGFFITWMDIMEWNRTYDLCVAAGFRVQRWPITWIKTSSCMNQSAGVNFTKATEIAIVCRKGNATLATHQKSCTWTGGNDAETKLYGHPFAKPAGLWDYLYNAVAVRGSDILDPFAGSCSSGIPAIRLGMKWRGIECSDKHYSTGHVNLMNLYKALDPTCQFS